MRVQHPPRTIFLLKLDVDAAYRRIRATAAMAVLTITIIQEIAYILLRLPFGVSNGPNDYSIVIESIFDLTNDIFRDKIFDPQEVYSPIQGEIDQPATYHTDNTPFGPAWPLFLEVPFHPAKSDGYIEDVITVAVDIQGWVAKVLNTAPLAIHSIFRPTKESDPLPRDDSISKRKLKGEGRVQ